MREDTEDDAECTEETERLRISLSRWQASCIILGLAFATAFFWGFLEHGENQMTNHFRREEIVAAASRLSSDSPERMEALFDSARFLKVEEAIPLAVMYAVRPALSEEKTQYHVLSARRYLKLFDLAVIEKRVREAAVSGAFRDADALLLKLPDLLR